MISYRQQLISSDGDGKSAGCRSGKVSSLLQEAGFPFPLDGLTPPAADNPARETRESHNLRIRTSFTASGAEPEHLVALREAPRPRHVTLSPPSGQRDS